MTNPLMLADFLTQSYDAGGLVGLLALNSLFVLINNFNLLVCFTCNCVQLFLVFVV